jgi:hypothetical protein
MHAAMFAASFRAAITTVTPTSVRDFAGAAMSALLNP